MTQFVMVAMALTLISCQPKSSASQYKKGQETTQIRIDIDDGIEGQYLAVFETLNPQITSRISGAFTFSREKELDEMVGDVRITNAGVKVIHAQNVRQGRRCPTMDDDQNHDGIIDAVEGEAVYGPILFPLDGDLTTQSSHDGEFPMGDIYGNYIYSRVAKFSDFMADLRSEPNSEGYLKLRPQEALRIAGRAVVVHGIDQSANLPETVRSTKRGSPYQALPIVCGIINKLISSPGEVIE